MPGKYVAKQGCAPTAVSRPFTLRDMAALELKGAYMGHAASLRAGSLEDGENFVYHEVGLVHRDVVAARNDYLAALG